MRFVSRAAFCVALLFAASAAPAETLKLASPQRGSWEGAIPELGKQQGIFTKHGVDLDIVYTSGGGETLQIVIAGAVDVGLSAGMAGSLGAFAKGAPIRVIAASSTGSQELFWYTPAESPLTTLKAAANQTIAYSTSGSSTHIAVLRFIQDYALKGMKPVATGDVSATITQVMSGQIDIGWSVAPFNLEPLRAGKIRLLGKASDVPRTRAQTIRVQIANAAALEAKRDLFRRYLAAYRETLDWMYAAPEAVTRYMAFSGLPEASVRQMIAEFIPKESLQMDEVRGVADSQQDAVQFKFLSAPLSEVQLADLIRLKP